ncbi:FmdB family zinc ribbon protein [Nitriliruptor alkaliphilus]|uniref:FmdB family zinc ribbon protein n=1 Tax=Nitriliruptor alkaliphilus TaxID=427918 RepID=UPI0009F8DE3D|nr:FmdB family zinc ribbon protein [Nitriliruptor alkaliphilus]
MPTYEYACRSCGQHLEVVQSFKDDALTECPSCEGQLRKVFSAAGIIFKGSGWHVKDYAGSSKGASTTSSGSSDSGTSDSRTSGSSDSGTSDTSSSDSSSSSTAATSASSSSTTSDAKSA